MQRITAKYGCVADEESRPGKQATAHEPYAKGAALDVEQHGQAQPQGHDSIKEGYCHQRPVEPEIAGHDTPSHTTQSPRSFMIRGAPSALHIIRRPVCTISA